MTCTANTPISVGGWTIGIETLSTALSLFAAFYFFNKWKDDVNNLTQLAEDYTQIGEEYCQKSGNFRQNEIKLLQYAKDLPDIAPNQRHAESAYTSLVAEAQNTLRRAYSAIPADAIGTRCQIRSDVARQLIKSGMAATADATIRQRSLNDRYQAAKIKALTDTLSGSPPNLGSVFQMVSETISSSMMSHSEAFNGAAYTAARGAGTLWQRMNGSIPTSSQLVGGLF